MRKRLLMSLVFLVAAGAIVGCATDNPPAPSSASVAESESAPASGASATSSDSRFFNGDGWTLEYPDSFDKVSEDIRNPYIQETTSGKNIQIEVATTTSEELELWLQSEIDRKLSADHADQSLSSPLKKSVSGDLTTYRYTIRSDDGESVDIPVIVLFDGTRSYEFTAHIPPFTNEEFEKIIGTFKQE